MHASRQLLACLAAAVLFAAAAPSLAAAAPAPDSAVVFVSGFTTTTPFTSSAPQCAGQEGPTWGAPTGAPEQLRAAGYAVFTAPVGNHGKVTAPCTAPGQPVPPGSATIDSNGDVDANGQALLTFLSFLRVDYGITNVQLVGHSDGGLWSRSAITQYPTATAATPTIQSLTTLGTPHTGSFGADLAEYVHDGRCDTTGIEQDICEVVLPVLDDLIANLGDDALKELSSSYLAGWNRQQTIGCPVTVVAGTYVSLPSWIGWAVPNYYAPDDGIVGEASGLNENSLSLTLQQISAAPFQTIDGGAFPVVHSATLSSLLGTPNTLTNYAAIATQVQNTIASPPGSAACVGGSAGAAKAAGASRAAAAVKPSSGTLRSRFATLLAPDRAGRFAARPRDIALLPGRARVRCGRRSLAAVPLLGSRRLFVTVLPRCRGGIAVSGRRALIVRSDAAARSLEVGWRGTAVSATVRGRGLRDVRIETKTGTRWRPLPRSGRALLPLTSAGARVPVRAIARDARGHRYVATAQLAR
ncbi:triacylglycerol lipase [Conexibacter sp. CPCC 206217]|uniref:esterase/lipase family protein n=1 Tax=Conexibacter sp. CPCC 206217 TaxID=3064574 RepID=UPI0027279DC8|nr:alpha/beta hydrolase [Conexibacter sp. CPCC 206217]MDO8210251.1 alpha/beta hydrolase [Conexibacter sp. CPCC 206217]